MEVATRDGTTRRRCRMVGSHACAARRKKDTGPSLRAQNLTLVSPRRRILTHADRDHRGARGAAPGGARVGGTALRPRRPAVVSRRRDGIAPAVLGRPGGARLAGIARRRGARRRGLRPARAGGGARGARAGVRAGPVPAHRPHGGCAASSRQGDRRRHRARAGVGRDRRDGRGWAVGWTPSRPATGYACAARSGPCPRAHLAGVLVARAGDEWCALVAGEFTATELQSLDPTRRVAEVHVEGAVVPSARRLRRRGNGAACGIWRRRCSRPRVWAWRSGASRPRPSTPRCGSSSAGPSASSRA